MTQNGIIWFKLCRFSGLIYNTIYFHLQKVQILKKKKKEKRGGGVIFIPPEASNIQTATLKML